MASLLRDALADALIYASRLVDLPGELAAQVEAIKAKVRDLREPGRRKKRYTEMKLEELLVRVFARQARMVEQAVSLHTGRKALADIDDWFDFDWDPLDQVELINILQVAVREGINLLTDQTGIQFDPTRVNTQASKWALNYAGKLVRGINQTSLEAVRQAVNQFVTTPGMNLGDLMNLLPYNPGRAEKIAVTETTRSYAEGNLEAGRIMEKQFPGVSVVKEWFTNEDDRVCPVCGPLNETIIGINDKFDAGGIPIDGPPAHVNCRCWIDTRTDING